MNGQGGAGQMALRRDGGPPWSVPTDFFPAEMDAAAVLGRNLGQVP